MITALNNYPGFIALLAVLLSILGWFVIYILNLKQQKKHLQNEYRMKIYEEITELKKNLDDRINNLNILLCFKIKTIFEDIKNLQQGKNHLVPLYKNETECWISYMNELNQSRNNFNDVLIDYYYIIEKWIEVFPAIKKSKKTLCKDLNNLNKISGELIFDLQIKNFRGDGDFNKRKQEVIDKTESLNKLFDETMGYLWDFIIILHNELLAPVFNIYLNERDLSHIDTNVDIKYKILTIDGTKKRMVHKVNLSNK